MNSEINRFQTSLHESWMNLIEHSPKVIGSIIILLIGLFIIKLLNKYAKKAITNKANDPLIAAFILSIISLGLTVLLFIICLEILGFDDITNKILAGAGLTTFIIGFALKDIGENFLAGILMAFQRPFRIGDLIQIENIKGRVIEMSLRSTTVKTLDGIDAYIPNGSILKNNLENFTIDQLMRNDFIVSVNYDEHVENALDLINSILAENEFVLKVPSHSVVIEKIENDIIYIGIYYWYRTDEIKAPAAKLKSDLQIKVYKALKSKAFNLPTTVISYERIEKNS